jgi:L-ascorbate metabolism protein UlaG (beta-lactamase superfamily)
MPDVPLTWLGHGSFRFDSPSGKRVYVDPWLGNPKCPESEREPERVDLIVLTHGHGDHLGETVELWKRFSPRVIAQIELRTWLAGNGLDEDAGSGFNKGGTIAADGIRVTLTDAKHSSSAPDGAYVGEAGGLVFRFENGTTIYFAGDTCVFGDMQLIGRVYEPDVVVLPIGGFYTMDPEQAAVALELLAVRRCVPCHYGTFPLLAGSPAELAKLAPDVEILTPEPGETVMV